MSIKLTPKQREFIDGFADFGIQSGLTRSVSRVLALLIICQPSRQTAADIQQALGLSAGSISTATTLLVRIGLVDEIKVPGNRRLHYELKPDGFKRALVQRLRMSNTAIEIAKKGLAFDPDNERLSRMYDTYVLSAEAVTAVLEKFEALYKK